MIKEKESVERAGPDKSWDHGPYVKITDRQLWNDLYQSFEWELEQAMGYDSFSDVKLSDKQIHILAWNLAYEALWTYHADEC